MTCRTFRCGETSRASTLLSHRSMGRAVGLMVDAQGSGNGRSCAHNPTNLTHTDLQLLQLLRLEAHAHNAQAVADAGPDLAVERAVRHGPDSFAEGLDDLPEGGKPANPELLSLHRVLFSASGTFLRHFCGPFQESCSMRMSYGFATSRNNLCRPMSPRTRNRPPVRCAGQESGVDVGRQNGCE